MTQSKSLLGFEKYNCFYNTLESNNKKYISILFFFTFWFSVFAETELPELDKQKKIKSLNVTLLLDFGEYHPT